MALAPKRSGEALDLKAAETLAKVNSTASPAKVALKDLEKKTEVVSFRVPIGERTRLRLLFARKGLTLADAVKTAVYDYAGRVERGEV